MKRPTVPKKVSPLKNNQLTKFHATKRPGKVTKPSRNVEFKSSKETQKKKNLQAKFEELDIAMRNAARNSWNGTLLREEEEEEEEEKKRLRYRIGLESSQEPIPSGQPIPPLSTHTPDVSKTNMPIETISDDDASDLILLKDLKPLVRSNLENRQDHAVHEPTNIKQEVFRKEELNIEKEQDLT